MISTDFLIANLGGLIAITPISPEAKDVCIGFESWQMMGGSIMVDHRMAPDLIENLQNDGYSVVEEE